MFGLGSTELIIILLIALVIFGGSRLRNLGGDLGGAISEFKNSLGKKDEEEGKPEETSAPKTEEKTAE